MLTKMLRALWGDLTAAEIKKFFLLSITFFLIIGTYWMMRVMKDGIFDYFVDFETYQPVAKVVSIFFVVFIVAIYGKLVDLLRRKSLFYTVSLFYGIGFVVLSLLMLYPQLIGPLRTMFPGKDGALLGWTSYLFLESFGSIVPAMFWALVASTVTAEEAKRGYGMIVAMGQLGTILGTGLVLYLGTSITQNINISFAIFGLGGLIICLVPLFIRMYMDIAPEIVAATKSGEKKAKTGMLEGIRLIVSNGYILGILVVSVMYEVVGTLVEYQMNVSAKAGATSAAEAAGLITFFKSFSGFIIGIVAFIFAILGTSFFMRTFGLRFCLVAFPTMIAIVMASIFACYQIGVPTTQMVWVFLIAVVIFKALSYALNNPTKEVMYIPTSKDVKFKAKSWIDAFGNRTAKGAGASINGVFAANVAKADLLPMLLNVGTVVSLGIVGFWIVVAFYVGNKFNKLQEEGTIIE